MNDKIKMEVKIRGKFYTIISDEKEEYIYKICSYVDKKVSEIASVNPRLGTEMASILTAINSSDEYFKIKDKADRMQREIAAYTDEISKLEEKLRNAEEKLEALQKHVIEGKN